MIARGAATVRVLPTTADWFGVTYREDRPRVVESIARLVASGVIRPRCTDRLVRGPRFTGWPGKGGRNYCPPRRARRPRRPEWRNARPASR